MRIVRLLTRINFILPAASHPRTVFGTVAVLSATSATVNSGDVVFLQDG